MALTPFVLVGFLLFGYIHYTTHPLLKPLVDRKDAKFLYTSMAVKGMVFVVVTATVLYGIQHLLEFAIESKSEQSTSLMWIHVIASSLALHEVFNRESELPFASFLSFLTPILTVYLFNFCRPSYWAYRKKPIYCIWHASNTMERWVIQESGKLTRESANKSAHEITQERRLSRVVLDNDKVYIGVILSIDMDNGGITHIHIAPYYSGYINEKRHLCIEERYSAYYKQLIDRIRLESPHLKENGLYAKLFKEFAVIVCIDNVVVVSSYSRKEHAELECLRVSNEKPKEKEVN